MNRKTISILWGAVGAGVLWAQGSPSTLQVDLSSYVLYNYDTFDTSQFGTNRNATNVMMKTYNYHISIADITAVNGAPAKGALLCTHTMFVLSPTAAAGGASAMADTSRSMIDDCSVEILSSAGSAVGTIFFRGLFGGAPPPGAPANSTRSNFVVTGGTGAYLGVRGQATQSGPWTPRVASVTEDPANRRINGGGTQRVILQVFPMFRPSVVMLPAGPAVVHSSDYSLVTSAKPAKAGEILILFANGLGPTNPPTEFGAPFPKDTSVPVTSPVQVIAGGNPAEVLYAGSYPGSVDGYQVNFRLPSGVSAGSASVELQAAFVAASPVAISIQ